MSILALTNEYLIFNAVDLSDHVKSAVITANAAMLDSTAMGDTWIENTGGLKSGTLAVTFNDDFAVGSVDATTFAAFLAGVAVAAAVKPVNGAIAATNPEYQFNVQPAEWSMGGSVGDLAAKTLTFPITGAITRDVTP